MATSAPSTPADVTAFWFGPAATTDRPSLSTAAYFSPERNQLWYSGTQDALCAPFAPLVRAAGAGTLGWAACPQARLAEVILTDQISRGAFRGTREAFAYDQVALAATKAALAAGDEAQLQAAELLFLLMPLMHSESAGDQAASVDRFSALAERFPTLGAPQFGKKYAAEHAAVVTRFGRYPHRNAFFGRETTAEEAAWLAAPECPAWAKSQAAPAA